VAADYGLGLDDNERVHPAIPESAQCNPKQSVATFEVRPRTLAFEHRDLLTQGEDFQAEIVAGAEKAAQVVE
jgi:hypothetical protein